MKLAVNQGLDEKSWDNFLLHHPKSNLLQSWAWGDFQESLGNTIWRFQVTDNEKIIAQFLAIRLSIGLGKYILYAPRDILINKFTPAHQQHESIKLIVDKTQRLAKEFNLILLRIEPAILEKDQTTLSIYHSLGFVRSLKTIQPQEELILDIKPPDHKLLANMKSKTLYNIKLAAQKNIEVATSTDPKDISIFNKLNAQTAERGHFKAHDNTYYEKQLKTLGDKNAMELLIAYWQDAPVAAGLFTFFGKTATYLHGASNWRHRDKMAPYAMHWTAIQQAKHRGCLYYNLGGVNTDSKKPSWAGITRFKLGFGGEAKKYIGALELPLDKTWFKFYKFINLFKK